MTMLTNLLNDLYHVASWAMYAIGGGAVVWIIIAVAALVGVPFAGKILDILSPALKAVVNWVVDFVDDVLIPGAVDVLDNWKTMVFVAVVAGSVGYFSWQTAPCPPTPKGIARMAKPVKHGTSITKYFTLPKKSAAYNPAPKKPVVESDSANPLVKPFW